MPRPTSEISTATFHTYEPPTKPPQYEGGLYRHIAGIEADTGEVVHPLVTSHPTTPIELRLPTTLIENTQRYFDHFYIKNPEKYRNCHIGALAIAHATEADWVDALAEANTLMWQYHTMHPGALAMGARGVFGSFYNGEPFAFHSVVGVDEGISIQTDRERGPLSLVSTKHSLAYYAASLTDVPSDMELLQMYSNPRKIDKA